jgi:hypothetical protein
MKQKIPFGIDIDVAGSNHSAAQFLGKRIAFLND